MLETNAGVGVGGGVSVSPEGRRRGASLANLMGKDRVNYNNSNNTNNNNRPPSVSSEYAVNTEFYSSPRSVRFDKVSKKSTSAAKSCEKNCGGHASNDPYSFYHQHNNSNHQHHHHHHHGHKYSANQTYSQENLDLISKSSKFECFFK